MHFWPKMFAPDMLNLSYQEVLDRLSEQRAQDRINICDIEACLSFDGRSFLQHVLDVCASHGNEARSLVDGAVAPRPSFPRHAVIGGSDADILLAAAALRLADILDFDRDRTPPVVFRHLVLDLLDPAEHKSALEWGKHLAIEGWRIESDQVVFEATCTNPHVHRAIIEFCKQIGDEVRNTYAALDAVGDAWPFQLPRTVIPRIREDGYRYLAHGFELDHDRVYHLLLTGGIYPAPVAAVRELVQNAVDACVLRDRVLRLRDEALEPRQENRIVVRYTEPSAECNHPTLVVEDSGTGMTVEQIEEFFLRIGRSYYNSAEFMRTRAALRSHDLDFAPVSEFGIGFLSSFLLADDVVVETSTSTDGPVLKLNIRGPTRLIAMSEVATDAAGLGTGTRVTLKLLRGDKQHKTTEPVSWKEVKSYLLGVCVRLPYTIRLEHVDCTGTQCTELRPLAPRLDIDTELEKHAIRIPVDDRNYGLRGEIVLLHPGATLTRLHRKVGERPVLVSDDGADDRDISHGPYRSSPLIRGGFAIGSMPGLPHVGAFAEQKLVEGHLEVLWGASSDRRYPMTDLARTRLDNTGGLWSRVVEIWLGHLIEHAAELPPGQLHGVEIPHGRLCNERWLERYTALQVYELAKNGWRSMLEDHGIGDERMAAWEAGSGAGLDVHLALGDFKTAGTCFYSELLDLVLPIICELQMTVQNTQMGVMPHYRVAPPRDGWRETLAECTDFVTKPRTWGGFAQFLAPIDSLFFYDGWYRRFFNSVYRRQLEDEFTEPETKRLMYALASYTHAGMYLKQIRITPESVDVLRRARARFGQMKIGGQAGEHLIVDLPLP